ncbi:MAG TPA: hypothetical protein VF489_11910 [Sphingobium sp.]
MTGKSGWVKGSLLGVAMLISGGAGAQTQPRHGYPESREAQDPSYGDDATSPADEDDIAPQDQGRADEDFSDVAAADEQHADTERQPDSGEDTDAPAASAEHAESEPLINACALAARDEAERDGGYAEVRQMEAPRESRNGFSVDGDIEARSSWRAQDGKLRHFTCTVSNGRVEDVYFRRERASR